MLERGWWNMLLIKFLFILELRIKIFGKVGVLVLSFIGGAILEVV